MTRHRQVRIKSPCGRISVDEGMAPILRACWAAGWLTWASCQNAQDDGTTAYIVFCRPEDADAFIATALAATIDTSSWRTWDGSHPFDSSSSMRAVYFPRELLNRVAT